VTPVVDQPEEQARVGRRAFVAGTLAAAAAATAAACSSGPSRPAAAAKATSTTSPSTTAPASVPGGPAAFVAHGPRTKQAVALTFHLSGDRGLVNRLLDGLSQHGVVVTAFVVGRWLDANPDIATRLVADGHELANHTYTHPTFHRLTPVQMADEITRCRDSLVRLAHTPGDYFRLSGTSNGTDTPIETALRAAGDAGYATVVGFDVDPADYADPGRASIVRRTTAALQPGSIVSLHFGHQGTVDALPDIVALLHARGLEAVTTSALLDA
jgi:peptidoglycan/xylan/chitin deacetylase (PgdA/CDA1 family)